MNRVSEYDIRKGKIQTLRELGIVPFAQTWAQNVRIGELKNSHPELVGGSSTQ